MTNDNLIMENKFHILIFEPDDTLKCMLQEGMQTNKFNPFVVSNSSEFQQELNDKTYHLCIIDTQGAEFVGIQLLKHVKESNEDIPVIMIASHPSHEDITIAYRLGTDDFVRKPFSLYELKARMTAILKRTCNSKKAITAYYQIGEYLFNNVKRTLTFEGVTHKLTTKETELLNLFCSHPDQLIERNYTLRTIWHEESYFSARSMDVYLTKLRQLLKHDPNVSLVNIHGKGYRLKIKKDEMSIRNEVI